MKSKYQLTFLTFVCTLMLTIVSTQGWHSGHAHAHGHGHGHGHGHTAWSGAPTSYVSFDMYGNCYAHDRPLVGRCVPYRDCISALRSGPQVTPLFCPSTSHEQLVCCPHGGYVLAAPIRSKSEQACAKSYPRGRHKRSEPKAQPEPQLEPLITRLNHSENQVVGGTLTQQHEHPYMCALGWRSSRRGIDNHHTWGLSRYVYHCGCVLISRRFALTAGHCANVGGESPAVALIGGVDLNDTRGHRIDIEHITRHPHYDEETLTDDLAVIQLARSAHHPVACLWTQESIPERPLTALGYGQTKFAGPHSNQLLQVLLYPLDNPRCQRYVQHSDKLSNGLGPGQLCAGDYSGRMDTCQGDSGGPLLLLQHLGHRHPRVPYVVGLTSFGGACASGEPGIYVRIVHYLRWIEEIVWN
ncbi:serine protease snake [Drosophila subobscura]|uniref:serine protease snake n=1 Tax=Drosophila subobscura TaxID=7241 RepID=UPI00155A8C4D|nr:serine protease snake [Drosophila subobscura]